VPDVTAENLAMLGVLARVGTKIIQAIGDKFDATGRISQEDAVVLEIVGRATRRTVAVRERISADSKKTPEERAAERARRAEAAEGARLDVKRDKMKRVIGRAVDAGQSDRENLLHEMYERLLDPDVEMALTRQDVFAVVRHVCQEFGITPKNEFWSDDLLAAEIAAADADIQRYEAERAAGMAAIAAGADWREGIEFSPVPDAAAPPPDAPLGRDPPDTG
jgi:signal recognition particle GTPase